MAALPMSRATKLFLALPLAALLASGCRPAEEKEPGPANPAAAETPRRGGTVVTGWTA
jgi:hypothetical protein